MLHYLFPINQSLASGLSLTDLGLMASGLSLTDLGLMASGQCTAGHGLRPVSWPPACQRLVMACPSTVRGPARVLYEGLPEYATRGTPVPAGALRPAGTRTPLGRQVI